MIRGWAGRNMEILRRRRLRAAQTRHEPAPWICGKAKALSTRDEQLPMHNLVTGVGYEPRARCNSPITNRVAHRRRRAR